MAQHLEYWLLSTGSYCGPLDPDTNSDVVSILTGEAVATQSSPTRIEVCSYNEHICR